MTRESKKSVFCRARFSPNPRSTHWRNGSWINYSPTAPMVQHRSIYRSRSKERIFNVRCGSRSPASRRAQPRTYGELARRVNGAARAVGQACGDNRLPLAIPCHRVVAASGIGGFAHHRGGAYERIKRWLLVHEAGTNCVWCEHRRPERLGSLATMPSRASRPGGNYGISWYGRCLDRYFCRRRVARRRSGTQHAHCVSARSYADLQAGSLLAGQRWHRRRKPISRNILLTSTRPRWRRPPIDGLP